MGVVGDVSGDAADRSARADLQRPGADRRPAAVGIRPGQRQRPGAELGQIPGTGDHAREFHGVGTVEDQMGIVGDVSGDAAGRAARADLQRAGGDRRPARIGIRSGQCQNSVAALGQRCAVPSPDSVVGTSGACSSIRVGELVIQGEASGHVKVSVGIRGFVPDESQADPKLRLAHVYGVKVDEGTDVYRGKGSSGEGTGVSADEYRGDVAADFSAGGLDEQMVIVAIVGVGGARVRRRGIAQNVEGKAVAECDVPSHGERWSRAVAAGVESQGRAAHRLELSAEVGGSVSREIELARLKFEVLLRDRSREDQGLVRAVLGQRAGAGDIARQGLIGGLIEDQLTLVGDEAGVSPAAA